MDDFENLFGFGRGEADLANWRTTPFSRFAFQNTREFVPTAQIASAGERPEAPGPGEGALAGATVEIDGERLGWTDFLRRSHTDVFLALKAGKAVAEWQAPHAQPANPHILFSVTKSVTGLLAGILEDRGLLDMTAPVPEYLPEARNSGFATATVQNLADMRTSLKFEEIYLDTDGDYGRYRRAMLWNPADGHAPETLADMLMAIPPGPEANGGPVEYASPNTDVLSLVIERASATRYADLLSEAVWKPLGARRNAYVTLDAAGMARGAGGLCATAHDLARLGEAIRRGGEAEGGRIVSGRWIDDMLHGGDSDAWQNGNFTEFVPDGRYRNSWYQTGTERGGYCCFGIHGQWLFVDPAAEAVVVKLSSQPLPADETLDRQCHAFFSQIFPIL